jgi:Tol biopolymer transport system component
MQRISLNSAEEQGNGNSSYAIIAANNRHVTYVSFASNMDPADPNTIGDIYVRDLVGGTTELISPGLNNQPSNGNSHYSVISDDGRFIAYHSESSNLVPNDTNNTPDVFLYDRLLGTTRRVSLSITGGQGNGPSRDVAISGNGRFIVFQSMASNLTSGDTNGTIDIFLYLDLPFRAYLPTTYQ